MATKQTITRKGGADIAHRVMNERMKCHNLHGHRYEFELVFEFDHMEDIGYAIDFKEIKRVGCQWIDDILDHGSVLNPKDQVVIDCVKTLGTKIWLMSLNGEGEYCNPSVENISKEIFMAQEILFEKYDGLRIHKIVLYETPNCYTECTIESISNKEWDNFREARYDEIKLYAEQKGIVEYDDRKVC